LRSSSPPSSPPGRGGTPSSGRRSAPRDARENWSWRQVRLEKDHHLYVVGFQVDPDESRYCRPSILILDAAEVCDDPNVLGDEFPPQ